MKKKIIKNIFLFYIIIFIYYIKIFPKLKIEIIISHIKSIKEFKRNEIFLKFIKTRFLIIKKYKRKKNPKVSLISPLYNRENYISKLLKIIQSQSFIDIEIILIDDCSKDNSIKLIEELQKKDERIILIKNNFNKGTIISRNIGSLYSNSKYVILPDPDVILERNIIKKTILIFSFNLFFTLSEKFNYEVIKFYIYKITESKL